MGGRDTAGPGALPEVLVSMLLGLHYRPSILLAVVVAAPLFRPDTISLAQSAPAPADERRFEVASVKPMASPFQAGAGGVVTLEKIGISTLPGGRFSASTVTLKQLIVNAFDVRDFQIEGGPPWLTSDYFEITATAGADASPADVRSMLRTLLAERFGLRTRSETRQASLYVLSLARADGRLGPDLKRTSPECAQHVEQRRAGTAPPRPAPNPSDLAMTPICGATSMMRKSTGATTFVAGGMELSSLVRQISNQLTAPVVDRTGLSGLFDITLDFISPRTVGGRPPGLDPNSTEPLPVPLEAAVQAQLGLRLEKEIGPMPIVIIDAAAPPTPD